MNYQGLTISTITTTTITTTTTTTTRHKPEMRK